LVESGRTRGRTDEELHELIATDPDAAEAYRSDPLEQEAMRNAGIAA
jgi:hypothetical protein